MSRSPYFFVEKFNNKTGKYELQHPLIWDEKHTEMEPADLFPYNGCHDMFSIVENDDGYFPKMWGIHKGLPENVSTDIDTIFKERCQAETNSYVIELNTPKAHWFTYADMYIYYLENPTIPGYDDEDDTSLKPNTMPNPIKRLMDRIDAFLSVMNPWDWRNDYSQIRIVYWIE